jgi:hypothetical protein
MTHVNRMSFFMPESIEAQGTKKERETFYSVNQHYKMGLEDLEARYSDWDKKLELFYSYINESGWPYSSQIFVPQTFTTIFEKMSRLNAGKPKGRLIPREGADVIKAKINNALLDFQWDDVARLDKEPMFAKWARMDLNARLYGASFALVKWRYETDGEDVIFDGPTTRVLNNRDCIYNPAYSTVRNWFQYRDYPTLQELENVNDVSQAKPRYKNLKMLKDSVLQESTKGGDNREINYMPKIRSMQGLSDYLGKDEDPNFRTVEIVTELRNDRIIVFAPKHGVILRDEPNPYKHHQIPVVMLKYVVVDDDIYGLSDIQPFEKVQKALNALTSQYVDAVNMDLYRILQVKPAGVQMHTLEYGPGKKWLMNEPGKDVVPLETSVASASKFVDVYSILTSMLKESAGETSAAFSTLQPGNSEKTATEISSLESTRSVRDTFNQNYLSEAIKQQMLLWLQMDQQFIFSNPAKTEYLLRIVGRSELEEFKKLGLSDMVPDTSEGEMMGAEEMVANGQDPAMRNVPMYPAFNSEGSMVPKMEMDDTDTMGTIHMVEDDLSGSYDYVVDVEPMRANVSAQEKRVKMEAFQTIMNPQVQQMLMAQGVTTNMEEVLLDLLDSMGSKGAEKYFTKGGLNEQANAIGPEGTGKMQPGGAPVPTQAAPGIPSPAGMAQGQSVPQLGRP